MTSREDILEQVRKIFREDFGLAEADVQTSSHLIDDLDFDSIDSIELAVRLADVAAVRVEEDELAELRTVGDIVELVHRHINGGEGGDA